MLKFNEKSRDDNNVTQFQGPFCYQRAISYQKRKDSLDILLSLLKYFS